MKDAKDHHHEPGLATTAHQMRHSEHTEFKSTTEHAPSERQTGLWRSSLDEPRCSLTLSACPVLGELQEAGLPPRPPPAAEPTGKELTVVAPKLPPCTEAPVVAVPPRPQSLRLTVGANPRVTDGVCGPLPEAMSATARPPGDPPPYCCEFPAPGTQTRGLQISPFSSAVLPSSFFLFLLFFSSSSPHICRRFFLFFCSTSSVPSSLLLLLFVLPLHIPSFHLPPPYSSWIVDGYEDKCIFDYHLLCQINEFGVQILQLKIFDKE